MESNKQSGSRIVTDARELGRQPVVSQEIEEKITPPELKITPPELKIIPPEEETPRSIKIKRTTPIEFDKETKIYIEPEDEYPDELEYKRTGNDQGIVIIFNQVQFFDDPDKKRMGSTKDVNDIIFTLGRLGYNIEEKYIFSNLSGEDVNKKLNEILEADLKNRNSLILFYLSHGELADTILTSNGQMNTRDIWEKLAEHKDLQNKPKFFVFQACKGFSLSTPFDKQPRELNHQISSVSLSSYPLPADVILCYSSAEGMKSYRDIEKGSWLIQEICKNFLAYGRRDDVFSLLTRVAKCVSTYTHRDTKQMPVIVSTLSKKFYLSKSKDRTNNLAIHQIYTHIYNIIDELEKKIKSLEKPPESRR